MIRSSRGSNRGSTFGYSYEENILSAEKVSLIEIARKVGTPAYVYSARSFLDPLEFLQHELRNLDFLVCFALKSNSNLSILRLLAKNGAGMDLVSGGELYRALKAGADPEKIVFSGVGKTAAEMKMALQSGKKGIFSFNVESYEELLALNRVASELKRPASVALRFNPDVNAKTHPYVSTGLKKNKFGMRKKEILNCISQMKTLPWIQLKGLSIHIGSQLLTLQPLEEAFLKLCVLIDEINPLLPSPLTFVDLGGGVGVRYKDEKPPSLKDYCRLISKYFGKSSTFHSKLKILIEPGRSLIANSGILLTQVLYRKAQGNKDFLIVDAGMNDLIRPALYESYHEILPLEKIFRRQMNTDVVGPVCESADCFAKDRPLSSLLTSGDYLGILSAGAYGFSMASTYNSRPRPAEVLIENGRWKVIRKREEFSDLVRGE